MLTSKENILHPNKKRDGRERPKVASTPEGKVASNAVILVISPRTALLSSVCVTTAGSQDMSLLLARLLGRFPLSNATLVVVLDTFKNCGRFGHFARNCQNAPGIGGPGFASRAPPPGRALNTSTLPPVKCYRCGGPNHLARDCLAAPGTTLNDASIPTGPQQPISTKTRLATSANKRATFIARDCPEVSEFVS
ncbi:hypothetical protein BJ912DRAFT_1057917 [Pholiota molesta]|nr:hypothetical protein BJ912DRAFT_1057917 [Pholiota molesta]